MSGFPRDKQARLLQLLAQELELFGKIRELTEEQSRMLAEEEPDEPDSFNESLDRRQEVIEQINGLHKESNPLMQSYISFSKSPGGKKIGEIEDSAGSLKAAIAECAELNEKNMAAAKEITAQYGQQIDKLSAGRKSIGLYVQGLDNKPEHFDKMT